MTAKDLSAILDIAAAVGLPVAEDYKAGTIQNYERLLEQAALVMAVTLPEDAADDHAEFVP
jgi:hypothetical protein